MKPDKRSQQQKEKEERKRRLLDKSSLKESKYAEKKRLKRLGN